MKHPLQLLIMIGVALTFVMACNKENEIPLEPTPEEKREATLMRNFMGLEGKTLTAADSVYVDGKGYKYANVYPISDGQTIMFSNISFEDSTAVVTLSPGVFELNSIEGNPVSGQLWIGSVAGVPYEISIPVDFHYIVMTGNRPPIITFKGSQQIEGKTFELSGYYLKYYSRKFILIEPSYSQNRELSICNNTYQPLSYTADKNSLQCDSSIFYMDGINGEALSEGKKITDILQLMLNTDALDLEEYITYFSDGFVSQWAKSPPRKENSRYSFLGKISDLFEGMGDLQLQKNVLTLTRIQCPRKKLRISQSGDCYVGYDFTGDMDGYKPPFTASSSPFKFDVVDDTTIKLYIDPGAFFPIVTYYYKDLYVYRYGEELWCGYSYEYNSLEKPASYSLISRILLALKDNIKDGIELKCVTDGELFHLYFNNSDLGSTVLKILVTEILDNPDNLSRLFTSLESAGYDENVIQSVKQCIPQVSTYLSDAKDIKFGWTFRKRNE